MCYIIKSNLAVLRIDQELTPISTAGGKIGSITTTWAFGLFMKGFAMDN